MNQKNYAVARENNIRRAGKIAAVKPEPIPHPMQSPAHGQLGGRIPGPDPRHVGAALGVYPGHGLNFIGSSYQNKST
jgi:hypothetical protein